MKGAILAIFLVLVFVGALIYIGESEPDSHDAERACAHHHGVASWSTGDGEAVCRDGRIVSL
jgi:hypothetical protein